MNRKIHFDTIQRYFILKYKTDIEQNEFVNNKTGEIYNVIFKKGTDIAVFSARENNSYICIDSNGEVIEKDNIIGYVNGINAAKDENGVIFSEKDLVLCYNNEKVDLAQIINMENILYPERTSLVLQTELRKNNHEENSAPFYVDEVVYVDNEEFKLIKKLEYAKTLQRYNTKKYKNVGEGNHGIVVINEDGDGLLIDTQGYDYARYMSYAPKIAPAIEQMLLEDMRRNAVHTMKLYVPLKVTYENYIDNTVTETEDVSHTWEVQEKIKEFNKFYGERGLAQCLEKNNPCKKKVYSIKPDVECVNDVVMGVIAIKMTKPLNDEEIADIKDFVTEQMADGWGELFEKQGIQVKDGQIFIHFWDKEQYYIKTDQEMETEQNQDIEMDGMQGIQGMQMY